MKGDSRTLSPVVCIAVTAPVTALTFYEGYLRFLSDAGWDVHLITGPSDRIAAFASEQGVAYHAVTMKRDPKPLHDLRSLFVMHRLILRLKPDVIIASTPKASLLSLLAAKLLRVPVRMYQVWGLRLETERGNRRGVYRYLEQLSVRFSTQVVANSASLAAALMREGIAEAVSVLGSGSSHGVDLERFSQSAELPEPATALREWLRCRPTDALNLVYIGRLHRDKGIAVLAEALDSCSARGIRLSLIVVGEDEGADLGSLLSTHRENISVLNVGAVEDPRPYMAHSDVLCLPTFREGFPNVVLECAGYEVPAITTDATGAIDSVINGVTGIIVPTGDAAAFADAIAYLAAEPGLRRRLGQAARVRAEQEFSRSRVWKLQERNLRQQWANASSR